MSQSAFARHSSLSTSNFIFFDLEFCYFNRLFRILDLVFTQLDTFTPFGKLFVFSISDFVMWIFCLQRNAIAHPLPKMEVGQEVRVAPLKQVRVGKLEHLSKSYQTDPI